MSSKYGFFSNDEEEKKRRAEKEQKERELRERQERERMREQEEWKHRHEHLLEQARLHDGYVRDVLNDYLTIKLRGKNLPFKITGPTTHFYRDYGYYSIAQEGEKEEGQEFPYAQWVGRIGNLDRGIDQATGDYHTHPVASGRYLDLRIRLILTEKPYFRLIQFNEYGNYSLAIGVGSKEGLIAALKNFTLNTTGERHR